VHEHVHDTLKLNTLCALLHGRVIWPYFIEESTTERNTYLTGTVKLYEFPQTGGTEYSKKTAILFQTGRSPTNFNRKVRHVLNSTFANRWNGGRGPVNWRLRSSELIPLNFFISGYVKSIIYAEKTRELRHLRQRI